MFAMQYYKLIPQVLMAIQLCAVAPLYAQRSLQFDDGLGHYGILSASGLTGQMTTFTFPPTGGLIVTVPPPGTPSLAWLSAGNTLVGTEKFGSINAYDVIMVANDYEILRLVSNGGAEIKNSLDLTGSSTELLLSGDPGTSGFTLHSSGSGSTPEWLPAGGMVSISNDFTGSGALLADANNLQIGTTATYYRLQNLAGTVIQITGLDATGSEDGRIIILTNISSEPFILRHQHSASLPQNRFELPGNSDVIIGPKGSYKLIYSSVTASWLSFDN